MRSKIGLVVLLLGGILPSIFTGGCASSPLSAIPARPESLGLEKVTFERRRAETWTLENGLRVFYLHDDEIPMMHGALYVRGGSLYQPVELAGLAELSGSQMREGGIPAFPTPEAFDKALDARGADIESGFGAEYGNVAFSCLSEDFSEIFGYFSDVVRRPSFSAKPFLLEKRLALEGIQHRKDSPETMAGQSFAAALYGNASPYGVKSSPESIERVSLNELRAFHSRFFKPQSAVLALSGSLSREVAQREIEKRFSDWRSDKFEPVEPPPLPETTSPAVYVLQREFDQATVIMGHLGPPRMSPDTYALALFDRYFTGGGFESVLFSEVRSKSGLAYSIGGGFTPGPRAGQFTIVLQTRNSEVLSAIDKVRQLLQDARANIPTVDKLNESKQASERSYVFTFAESSAVVQRAALLKLLDYPDDWDDTYLPRLAKITRDDVSEVVNRDVQPDKLVTVIVGKLTPAEVQAKLGGQVPVYTVRFDAVPSIDTVPRILGKTEHSRGEK